MNTVNKTVSSIIDDEYKAYAMYVLENRAIPSYIDGFKPSGLNQFMNPKRKNKGSIYSLFYFKWSKIIIFYY